MNIFQFVVAKVWREQGLEVPSNYGEPGAPDVQFVGEPRRRRKPSRIRRREHHPNSVYRAKFERSPAIPLSHTGELRCGTREAEIALELGRVDELSRIREAEGFRRGK